MKYKTKNKKGFSLVETIIYLAIFTMISILVINSFITVVSSFNTTRTNRSLLEAGINSMERMSREIRQAGNVDIGNSSFNLNTGVLQLNSTNENDDPIVIKFKREDSTLNLYKCTNIGCNLLYYDNLLGQNIALDSLIFRRIATTKSEAIKIEMILSDTKSKTNKTENFYDTIILRGGY